MFLLLDKIFQRCLHGVAVARSAPQEINPPYLTAVNLVYLLASTSVISCITKPILQQHVEAQHFNNMLNCNSKK